MIFQKIDREIEVLTLVMVTLVDNMNIERVK